MGGSKNTKQVATFFSAATLKKFVKRHVVGKKTRISSEALGTLDKMLDEVGGWVIRESEKMASSSGRSTIKAVHIRDAARLYIGWGEEE
ncbi:MAG: hypothetical protein ACE5NG_17910 [bacterium]